MVTLTGSGLIATSASGGSLSDSKRVMGRAVCASSCSSVSNLLPHLQMLTEPTSTILPSTASREMSFKKRSCLNDIPLNDFWF